MSHSPRPCCRYCRGGQAFWVYKFVCQTRPAQIPHGYFHRVTESRIIFSYRKVGRVHKTWNALISSAFLTRCHAHGISSTRREGSPTNLSRLVTSSLSAEFEPVTIVAFRALIEALIVPDQVRLPVEWAIYDRYGA
jgi:hypothetical protein